MSEKPQILAPEILAKDKALFNALFDERFDERFDEKMSSVRAGDSASLCLMVTKGTLDWAYPPFIIASTASALGWKVSMFFTFYGLILLKKRLDLQLSALGNPAMPMKMPYGPKWFRDVQWKIPNMVMATVPGFENMATGMMRKTLSEKGVAPISELRELCLEADVRLVGCQMTLDLFGWPKDEFIDGISEWAGAATYLSIAGDAKVNLFI